jgi:hypothetical protein
MASNIFIPLAIVLGAVICIILWIIEKTNKKELYFLTNKKKIIEYYLCKLGEIEDSNTNEEEKIEKIRTISKKLFNDYYNLDLNIHYSQLAKFFEEKNMPKLKEFSEIMLKYYYKDADLNKNVTKRLLTILKEEIKNMPIQEGDKMIRGLDARGKKDSWKRTAELVKRIKHYFKNKKMREEDTSRIRKVTEQNLPRIQAQRIIEQVKYEQESNIKKKIELLILRGENYIKWGDQQKARETYNAIKNLYYPQIDPDKKLFGKIIQIYNSIAN